MQENYPDNRLLAGHKADLALEDVPTEVRLLTISPVPNAAAPTPNRSLRPQAWCAVPTATPSLLLLAGRTLCLATSIRSRW
jgi:hypothetical protein